MRGKCFPPAQLLFLYLLVIFFVARVQAVGCKGFFVED